MQTLDQWFIQEGYWGFWKLLRCISSAAHNVLYPHSRQNCTQHSFPRTLRNFCKHCIRPTDELKHTDGNQLFSFLDRPLWTSLMSTVVTSWPLTCTDLLSWLVYSRNKYFRVGPNISEKFGNEVQIKVTKFFSRVLQAYAGSDNIAQKYNLLKNHK